MVGILSKSEIQGMLRSAPNGSLLVTSETVAVLTKTCNDWYRVDRGGIFPVGTKNLALILVVMKPESWCIF